MTRSVSVRRVGDDVGVAESLVTIWHGRGVTVRRVGDDDGAAEAFLRQSLVTVRARARRNCISCR